MASLQLLGGTIVLMAFTFVGGDCQALNAHINPAWVESGRELLARQGYQPALQAYQQGLLSNRDGFQGYRQGSVNSRDRFQGYAPSQQTSLFYLDNTGRLRPVYLDSRSSSLTDLSNYRSQYGNNGANSPSELYQPEPYYP